MIEADRIDISRRSTKSEAAFRTISEVSGDLDVPQHVLRFWEGKFPQIKPLKRGGGRRYYRPEDVQLLKRIRDLLYKDGYTIRGVQKLLRDPAARAATRAEAAETRAAPPAPTVTEAEPSVPEPPVPAQPDLVATMTVPAPVFDQETRQALGAILGQLEGLRRLLALARRSRDLS